MFTCRICEKICNNKVEMTDHVREYHQEEKESQTKKFTILYYTIVYKQNIWNVIPSQLLRTPKLVTLMNKKPMYLENMNASTRPFLEYHITNCLVRFENIMYSLGKLNEDFSGEVCGMTF